MLAQRYNDSRFEQYLLLEEKASHKNEFYQGEITAMVGVSANHNRIVGNIHAHLYNAIDGLESKSCEIFVNDLRLWIEVAELGTYPDVMIICGGIEFVEGRTDTVTNPQIIIEVLSKSTAEYDRSDKFQAYWRLKSFREYLLVDQYRVHVEYFRRVSAKQWELLVFRKLDNILTLQSIGVQIPLDKIYRNVDNSK